MDEKTRQKIKIKAIWNMSKKDWAKKTAIKIIDWIKKDKNLLTKVKHCI